MARNKRNESALRPGPVLTALALCALFVMLGVGYVWYKNQIDLLGHQIKERETRLADLPPFVPPWLWMRVSRS